MPSSRDRRPALVLASLLALGSSSALGLGHAEARLPGARLPDGPIRHLRSRERPEPIPLSPRSEVGAELDSAAAERATISFAPGAPATRASAELLALTQDIDAERTATVYSHRTKVRRKDGVYEFDCSGMINWMLQRVAERAYTTLDRERPVAASYVRVIAKAPSTRARGGWQRVATLVDVEPGDIFAWRRPKDWPKGGNTGHVGVVLAKPAAIPHLRNAWLVRIADSTRWRHQDDTRAEGETGFGMGTLLFVTDDDGHPIGYGWHGLLSGGYYETEVVFGRVH